MAILDRVDHCFRKRRVNLLILLILLELNVCKTSGFVHRYAGFKSQVWTRRTRHSQQQSLLDLDETVYYVGEGSWNETFIQRLQNLVPAVEEVSSLPEPLSPSTHNMYYLLRHGQSTANVDEVISSDRFRLAYSDKHGLTDIGYQQGKDSASNLLDCIESQISQQELADHETPLQHRLIMISSPFARARQTALACFNGLKESKDRLDLLSLDLDPSICMNDLLVERYFGKLDNEAIYTYAYVWPLDKFNVTHTAFGVESVAAVATRFHRLVRQLEARFHPARDDGIVSSVFNHIVLVSHADVLQIAQLYAVGVENIGEFSSYRFKSKCLLASSVFVLW
jgi:broad specificity phosphatase PhoE